MPTRGRLANLSTFAFTATPSTGKTWNCIGAKRPDGKFEPFHLYSVRPFMGEGFIVDVLKHCPTFAEPIGYPLDDRK